MDPLGLIISWLSVLLGEPVVPPPILNGEAKPGGPYGSAAVSWGDPVHAMPYYLDLDTNTSSS